MEQKGRTDRITADRKGRPRTEPLHPPKGEVSPKADSEKNLYVGIDVGSTSSDVVVLNESAAVLISDYRRTLGRPIETVRSQLVDILGQINPAEVALVVATGSVGRFFARIMDIPFVNEVPLRTDIARYQPEGFPGLSLYRRRRRSLER